jgi:hypothetical protein
MDQFVFLSSMELCARLRTTISHGALSVYVALITAGEIIHYSGVSGVAYREIDGVQKHDPSKLMSTQKPVPTISATVLSAYEEN